MSVPLRRTAGFHLQRISRRRPCPPSSSALTVPKNTQIRKMGGMPPPQPPFARNLAPTSKLPEDHELVWDDGVAPELTIDFDAQHVGKWEGLATWLGGFGFFAAIFGIASMGDPVNMNPAVNREVAGHVVGSTKIESEDVSSGDDEDEDEE